MIQDDIRAIVRDIRAAHKSDSESAPSTTIAEELRQDLEDVANFKGSPFEKQAALYCKRLGINYNKLSDAEFRQLVHILEKSKFLKAMPARGRNGNKKTAVAWCMFPCSSGFVLVVFSWERGLINLNLSRLFALTQG